MERSFDATTGSYWKKREQSTGGRSDYERQF
jgi:hypothetical protein